MRTEELRHKLYLASHNDPMSYRSEDMLPKEVEVGGSEKLPVTASFKNRSDRRLHRINSVIDNAKAQIAEADHTRRMSHEAAPDSFSKPLPDRKQRQHVLRLQVWRRHKMSLDKVDKRLLDVYYHMTNQKWDPLEA